MTEFISYSNVFELTSAEEAVINLELERIPIQPNTEVSGMVKSNGIPVAKATVKILDTNFNPVLHTLTNEAGQYQ